jgi:hypothetical protein
MSSWQRQKADGPPLTTGPTVKASSYLGGQERPLPFHYIVIFVVGAMIPYVSLMAGKMAGFA